MKVVLGLGGSIHDFAACVIKNKKPFAIEDERITRIRYGVDSQNPCHPAINYCMDALGINISDINHIVINDDLEHILQDIPQNVQKSIINHHLSHVYSSYFTSKFNNAAILVVDGAGSKKHPQNEFDETRETTSYYYASGNKITNLKKIFGTLDGHNPITNSQTIMSNSLGEFYRVIAESMGLGWLTGPGKMMGMAAYGCANNDSRYANILRQSIKLLPNGEFEINTNGPNGLVDKVFLIRKEYIEDKNDVFLYDAALANSAQIVFEDILIHCLDYLYTITKSQNLCLVGGAALNSIANGKLKTRSRFRNVHIVAYPGDNGLAIGSAIWGYINSHTDCNKRKLSFNDTPYLGKKYKHSEINRIIKKSGLSNIKSVNLFEDTANYIANGKIVAWFQDRSEFGPRALGNRSILADPRNPKIRDYINIKVKNREWYRPLAPAVLVEYAKIYFEIDDNKSSWMQFVAQVRKEYYSQLPGVTHIDGSARLQTVTKNHNKKFYLLICAFVKLTNTPILLNTSFNIKGQPIVETPEHALEAFLNSEIDVLVMDKYIITKNKP